MQGNDDSIEWEMCTQLTKQFGLLLSQKELASVLKRSVGGLRYSLCMPRDARTRAFKACSLKIGRRVYYPSVEVARIISSDHPE